MSSESSASRDAQTSVCSVRALRIYIDRLESFLLSDQLFVCYGGWAKGRAMSKQRLSHWIVDVSRLLIRAKVRNALCTLGPTQQGLQSRGMSIQDICLAAGWSSQNTFARFYKWDVQSLASQCFWWVLIHVLLPLFLGVAARTVITLRSPLWYLCCCCWYCCCPEFSAASIVIYVLCCLTQLSLCSPWQYC